MLGKLDKTRGHAYLNTVAKVVVKKWRKTYYNSKLENKIISENDLDYSMIVISM